MTYCIILEDGHLVQKFTDDYLGAILEFIYWVDQGRSPVILEEPCK